MTKITYNNQPLSSREQKILRAFSEVEGCASEKLLENLTGLNHSAVIKTIHKLKDKDYIRKSTVSKVTFYRENQDKMEEILR